MGRTCDGVADLVEELVRSTGVDEITAQGPPSIHGRSLTGRVRPGGIETDRDEGSGTTEQRLEPVKFHGRLRVGR
jgi:hypothetical protein